MDWPGCSYLGLRGGRVRIVLVVLELELVRGPLRCP